MATTKFIQAVKSVVGTTGDEDRVFDEVSIHSAEELMSLLWNFPTLAQRGLVDSAKLSGFAAPQAPSFMAAMNNAGLVLDQPRSFALGAAAPVESNITVGTLQENVPTVPAPAAPAVPGTIDKRTGMTWPVRD